MNEIMLKDYRCFHDEQTARLAPLTLLVGDNSTGKTSFMAMVRMLSDVAFHTRVPDFKEEPFDLGSFNEIAHHRGSRGSRASVFEAGFSTVVEEKLRRHFKITFGESSTTPIPVHRHLSDGTDSIDESFVVGGPVTIQITTAKGRWKLRTDATTDSPSVISDRQMLPVAYVLRFNRRGEEFSAKSFTPLKGSPPLDEKSLHRLYRLAQFHWFQSERTFASAPVRSKPRRTYDPTRPTTDPEGDYVPMLLADIFSRRQKAWTELKARLEDFGKTSGLFDEISIMPLGRQGSGPFQIQIRKFAGSSKGPKRNLIDVGYGVSQVLPVITEMLRSDAPSQFLLQQPEVHLHPSAQAALGSLFCEIADDNRQILVETHSDHLVDRVRMDVRDGKISPDDVSILWFERHSLDVRIHSLRIDANGNITDAPENYRAFFMKESARSLGV